MEQESWKREKEETGCQPPQGPVLCANGCGFFGSAITMDLCSRCYKDLMLKQATDESTAGVRLIHKFKSLAVETPATVAAVASESSIGGGATSIDKSHQGQVPNRCFSCRKRVGLTGFKCRCGYTFCSSHRYSEQHSCSFDYKTAGRDAIAKANPLVKADKVEKI